jgi:hypothetical protein
MTPEQEAAGRAGLIALACLTGVPFALGLWIGYSIHGRLLELGLPWAFFPRWLQPMLANLRAYIDELKRLSEEEHD